MNNYAVSKQYGHFVQIWHVTAMSKEQAWEIAEVKGKLMYQTVYRDIAPMRNYVTDIGNNSELNSITEDEYNRWLLEAIKLGMTTDYYCGLPFTDVT